MLGGFQGVARVLGCSEWFLVYSVWFLGCFGVVARLCWEVSRVLLWCSWWLSCLRAECSSWFFSSFLLLNVSCS